MSDKPGTKEEQFRATVANMLEKLDKVTAGREIKPTLQDRLLLIAAEEVRSCLEDYEK